MKEKIRQLYNLRGNIIKKYFIEQWKDVWFYQEYNGVKGWFGTQGIFFVGSNPSCGTFPTRYTDFFFEQLKKNGFQNANLTDLIKLRVKNQDSDMLIKNNLQEQKKFLEEEIRILKPRLIVGMGNRCNGFLKSFKYDNCVFMPHYSGIRFPRNKKKFIKCMKILGDLWQTETSKEIQDLINRIK